MEEEIKIDDSNVNQEETGMADDSLDEKLVAYQQMIDNFKENKKYSSVTNKLPAVFKDDSGNFYDAFGKCVEGDKKGNQLTVLNGFTAYWFAWYAFYPEVGFE